MIDCELDALLQLRSKVNEAAPTIKLSLNDLIIKALAHAILAGGAAEQRAFVKEGWQPQP